MHKLRIHKQCLGYAYWTIPGKSWSTVMDFIPFMVTRCYCMDTNISRMHQHGLRQFQFGYIAKILQTIMEWSTTILTKWKSSGRRGATLAQPQSNGKNSLGVKIHQAQQKLVMFSLDFWTSEQGVVTKNIFWGSKMVALVLLPPILLYLQLT